MNDNSCPNNQFYELVELELEGLQGFCQKLTGDPDNGNDLMQDALYKGIKNFHNLIDRSKFKYWIYTIVVNTFKSRVRRIKRERVAITRMADSPNSINQSASVYESRKRLEIAMSGLSGKEKSLLILKELEGWGYNELASLFSQTEASLRTSLHRVKSKMRKKLMKFYENPGSGISGKLTEESCVAVKSDNG